MSPVGRAGILAGMALTLCVSLTGMSQAQVVRDTVVELRDRRVHALCTPGDLPGAVLLHGAGSRAETFRPLLERWRGKSRLCAYDRRGHGASGPPPGPRTPERVLAELSRLLEMIRDGPEDSR